MSRPSFAEGVAVALAASLAGAAVCAALALLGAGQWALELMVGGLGFGYLLYLLARGQRRSGAVTAALLWAVITLALWATGAPFPLALLLQLGFLWLVRTWSHHSGPLVALADLGLWALGLASAVWALDWSGSLFLSLWCFFLVQALFVAIPSPTTTHAPRGDDPPEDDGRFHQAYRAAQSALRRLDALR